MRDAFDYLVELYGDFSEPGDSTELSGPEITVKFPEVDLGLIPGRGFLYSLILYAVVVPLLIYLPLGRWAYHKTSEPWEVTVLPKEAIFLPQLGGGSAGSSAAGKSAESPETAKPSPVAARSKAGISYQGAQPIVSNPPNPTNHVQTILQPGLANPRPLKTFVPLPNIVKMVALSVSHALSGSLEAPEPAKTLAQPEDQSAPALVNAQMPVLPIGVFAPVEHPKLTMPAEAPPAPTNVPLQALLKPLVLPKPHVKTKYAEPQILPGANGRDNRDLLVLSATPAPPTAAAKVPQAEARGQFAIAALPLLRMSDMGPGSEVAKAGASSVALGTQPETTVRNAAGHHSESGGAGTEPVPGGGKPGTSSNAAGGGGPASGASLGRGGMAAGSRTGSAAGSGFGTAIASGSGAGAGAGSGVFPGITIQGGEQSSGEVSGQVGGEAGAQKDTSPGGYSMTIVSNGNSGGGLGDFGVFGSAQVFTVYISMEGPPGDPVPSWTLEYAMMQDGMDPPGALAPPFPKKKKSPQWPAGLPARYRGQSIVVYGVISREGKLLNLRIMQSPNVGLDGPLFTALHQWLFWPAHLNGRPVAVEGLFGIPLTAQ